MPKGGARPTPATVYVASLLKVQPLSILSLPNPILSCPVHLNPPRQVSLLSGPGTAPRQGPGAFDDLAPFVRMRRLRQLDLQVGFNLNPNVKSKALGRQGEATLACPRRPPEALRAQAHPIPTCYAPPSNPHPSTALRPSRH